MILPALETSDDPFSLQPCQLLRRQGQPLLIHLSVVFPEQRCWLHLGTGLRQLDWIARHGEFSPGRVVDGDHHATFLEMGIVQDLSGGQTCPSGHTSSTQLSHDLVLMFSAPTRVRPIWVADEVSSIESTQESIPHVGAYRLDIDIDVIIRAP